MKRLSVPVLLTLALIFFLTDLCIAEDYTFRKTKWGMSKAQVKASEPLTVGREDDNSLGYNTSIINKDVLLLYYFINDQLYKAIYWLDVKHINSNLYLEDYKQFKKLLDKKYGPQTEEITRWLNDLYKDDRSDWGTAISVGHLMLLTGWETPDTNIALAMKGDNFEIHCVIEYESKDLKPLTDKVKEKEQLEAF